LGFIKIANSYRIYLFIANRLEGSVRNKTVFLSSVHTHNRTHTNTQNKQTQTGLH